MTGRTALTDRQKYEHALVWQRNTRRAGPVVPQRITGALDARGLYGPEVDRACGVQEPTVDLWESGELVPTAEQVEALSRLTGFPVAYFHLQWKPIGPVTICTEDGCERVDDRPDAAVLLMTGQGRLL